MRNYEIRADIQHNNDHNKNLNWTEHFCSFVMAENGEMAKRKAVKEVFNKTGFFVGPDKISIKRV